MFSDTRRRPHWFAIASVESKNRAEQYWPRPLFSPSLMQGPESKEMGGEGVGMFARVDEKQNVKNTICPQVILSLAIFVLLSAGCWASPSYHVENYIYSSSCGRTALVQTVSNRNEIEFVCVTIGEGPGGLKATSSKAETSFRIDYEDQIIFPTGKGRNIYFCENGSITNLRLPKRATKTLIENEVESYLCSEKMTTQAN